MPRKKKVEKPPSRSQRVAALQAKMNEKYKGRGRVRRASEYILPHLLRRCPSGLPSLDIATAGGLPSGTFIEIVGPEGTGKTELATVYMVWQQEIWQDDCALAASMTEFHFDKYYAKRRGLKVALHPKEIEALERADGEKYDKETIAHLKEQVGEFEEAFSPIAEVVWEMVIDFLKSRDFHIILIDSLGALMPKQEAEGTMEDKTYSGAAGVNTQFFHKFHASMGLEEDGVGNETLVIGVNQVRDKIGATMFDKDPKVGGGHAKDHGKSACILLMPGKKLTNEIKVGSKTKYLQYGKMIRWKILKGKHGFPEGASGELRYLYKHGFDRAYDILTEATIRGFVAKKGAWFSMGTDIPSLGISDGDRLGQGADKVCDFLRDKPELMDHLYDLILEEAGVTCNIR
jgi:RecA/RadA recombinase